MMNIGENVAMQDLIIISRAPPMDFYDPIDLFGMCCNVCDNNEAL
jgi:hypothetical protein